MNAEIDPVEFRRQVADDYRHDVLERNRKSGDYAGTVKIKDLSGKQVMEIVYRKTGHYDVQITRPDDAGLVDTFPSRFNLGSTVRYHVYDYDYESDSSRGGFTEGSLVSSGYTWMLPKIIFARMSSFGERRNPHELQAVIDFSRATQYANPVNMEISTKEVSAADVIEKQADLWTGLLTQIYNGTIKAEKMQTPEDKIEGLLTKDIFEQLLPVGRYVDRDIGEVGLERESYSTLVKIGKRHPLLALGLGDGVSPPGLAYLCIVADRNPDLLRGTFKNPDELAMGIEQSSQRFLESARYFQKTGRYIGSVDEDVERIAIFGKILRERFSTVNSKQPAHDGILPHE